MPSKGSIMQHKRRKRIFLLVSATLSAMIHASNNNGNRIGGVAGSVLASSNISNTRVTRSTLRELRNLSRILNELHSSNELSADAVDILHSLETTRKRHAQDGSTTRTSWLDEIERVVERKDKQTGKRRRHTDELDYLQRYPFETQKSNLRRGIQSPKVEPMDQQQPQQQQQEQNKNRRKLEGTRSMRWVDRSLSGRKSSEVTMDWATYPPAPAPSSDKQYMWRTMGSTLADDNTDGNDDNIAETMGDDNTATDDGLFEEMHDVEDYEECYGYQDLEYDDDAGYLFEDLIPVVDENVDNEDSEMISGEEMGEENEEEDDDHKGDFGTDDENGAGGNKEDDDKKDDDAKDDDHGEDSNKEDDDKNDKDDDIEEDSTKDEDEKMDDDRKEEERDDDKVNEDDDKTEDENQTDETNGGVEEENGVDAGKDDDMISGAGDMGTEMPSVASETTSPSTSLDTASPTIASETTSPMAASETPSPTTSSETVSPTTAPNTVSPTTVVDTMSPSTALATASPSVASVATSPSITTTTTSPSIASATTSPSTAPASLGPSIVSATATPSIVSATTSPSISSTANSTTSPTITIRKLQNTIYVYDYAKSGKATKSSKHDRTYLSSSSLLTSSSATETTKDDDVAIPGSNVVFVTMPNQNHGKSSKSAAKSGKTKSGKRCYIIKKDDGEVGVSDGYCGKDYDDATSNCEEKCKTDADCSGKYSCFGGIKECTLKPEKVGANYCGEDFSDASKCTDMCETDSDCLNGETCFSDVTECVKEEKDQYCGTDREDATKCSTKCQSDDDCSGDESCFANITDCSEGKDSNQPTSTPTQISCPDGCLDCDQEAPLLCPPPELKRICDKHNNELYPPGDPREGEREANFIDCYEMCKPSFCCIHDSTSKEYAPSCSHKFDNCPLYYPCYIIWWKLHDTIGPATYMRVEQDEPFYEGVKFEYLQQDFAKDQTFFQQLFGHHFDVDDAPTDDTFENEDNW